MYDYMYEYMYPTRIYLFKANNRNTRTRCEICSKLTRMAPEFSVFIVKDTLVSLLLTLNIIHTLL